MKRDINLSRAILLAIEDCETSVIPYTPSIEGYSKEAVIYHIDLLVQESFLNAIPLKSQASVTPHDFRQIQLTAKGHDFLDNARNDTVWKKVMAEAEEKGTSTAMVVINGLLTKFAQKYAGLD